jgi:hypothetical protein
LIPLVGCRVEFISGPHADKAGVVVGVMGYRDRLRTMDEEEARLFVKSQNARLGSEWPSIWFEAQVTLDEGIVVSKVEGKLLKVLDTKQVRGSGYKSL